MNVNPGELNKIIRFLRKPYLLDAEGYDLETPVGVYTCHAKFSRVSGTEKVKSGADMSEVKVRFLIRYPKTVVIDRKMLIEYGDNTYEIEYINDYDDGGEYIEIWSKLRTTEAKT